jgi:hypothetical protein
MNSAKMTNAEIRAIGWQALVDKLGASGAVRFALQTERGHGDYTELRHQMLGALSVDELLERMRQSKSKPGRTRGSGKASKGRAPRSRVSRRAPGG